MDKKRCENITTHPISYIMQGQTDVSARNTREHKQFRANTSVRPNGNPFRRSLWALRHSFGELKLPSSQALLRYRNAIATFFEKNFGYNRGSSFLLLQGSQKAKKGEKAQNGKVGADRCVRPECYNGSPANYRWQKTRVRSPLHFTAVLNLDCSLLFFLNSFSLYFFEKSTKNGAAVYGIRCFLCSRVALRHLSVGAHLAARCLSQCLGRQELASLKQHAACFQSLLGYSLCLPTLPFRPWRGITFCNQ